MAPLDMSWMGVSQFMGRLDVPGLVNSGALAKKAAEFQLKGNDSLVSKKITTAFLQLEKIDSQIGQRAHPRQPGRAGGALGAELRGLRIPGPGQQQPRPQPALPKRSGGTSYDDVLPSLNLRAEIKPDLIARFGLGMATARPQINDMRAGTSTPRVIQDPGPEQGRWDAGLCRQPGAQALEGYCVGPVAREVFQRPQLHLGRRLQQEPDQLHCLWRERRRQLRYPAAARLL